MTWETYYKKFSGWTDLAQLRYISFITNFGPPHEICEIAEACMDEKATNKLICRAMISGVKFTSNEIARLENLVDKNLYRDLVKKHCYCRV